MVSNSMQAQGKTYFQAIPAEKETPKTFRNGEQRREKILLERLSQLLKLSQRCCARDCRLEIIRPQAVFNAVQLQTALTL